MLQLRYFTPPAWVDVALKDFDHFLLDHASCERKASAVGMSFVIRYPGYTQIIEPMIQFAREELEHFHQVVKVCQSRGLTLLPDQPDEYVNLMMKEVRPGIEERFLDRLLVSALIEARGHERLTLVADRLEDEKLRHLYYRLARAEGAHKDFFIEMAKFFFDHETIEKRLDELTEVETRAIQAVPYRSAVH